MVTNRGSHGIGQRARLSWENSASAWAFDWQAAKEALVKVPGHGMRLQELLGLLDDSNSKFEIVPPKAALRRP